MYHRRKQSPMEKRASAIAKKVVYLLKEDYENNLCGTFDVIDLGNIYYKRVFETAMAVLGSVRDGYSENLTNGQFAEYILKKYFIKMEKKDI